MSEGCRTRCYKNTCFLISILFENLFPEIVYMYGGWDGNHDLADLWAYHVQLHKWQCISKNTEEQVCTTSILKYTEEQDCIQKHRGANVMYLMLQLIYCIVVW